MFTHIIPAHEITILQTSRHRNGVSGAPFDVILFTYENTTKMAVVFEKECHCAIVDVASLIRGDVTSKWRGDAFEPALRRLLTLQD